MNFNIVLSSLKDKNRLEEQIKIFKKNNEDIGEEINIDVHIASPYISSNKVGLIFKEISSLSEGNAFICSSGKSNLSTGNAKSYASLKDLVIGVPLKDSQSGGVSSFVSMSEKPRYFPVLATGLENITAALNFAHRFYKNEFSSTLKIISSGSVSIKDTKKVFEDMGFKSFAEINSPNDKEYIGLDVEFYDFKPFKIGENINKDDVVINFYNSSIRSNPFRPIDDILAEGNGLQISVLCSNSTISFDSKYANVNTKHNYTCSLGVNAYWNALQVASQILRLEEPLKYMKKVIDKSRKDMEGIKTIKY